MKKYKKTIGAFGENIAKNYLKKHGYIIVDSNVKLGNPEIDIISKYKKELIFIEVKTRTTTSLGLAEEALKSSQIKTLKRAILLYCSKNKLKLANSRLDFIAIDINKETKIVKIKHFKDII